MGPIPDSAKWILNGKKIVEAKQYKNSIDGTREDRRQWGKCLG
jgi:hypothetical protein